MIWFAKFEMILLKTTFVLECKSNLVELFGALLLDVKYAGFPESPRGQRSFQKQIFFQEVLRGIDAAMWPVYGE